MKPAIRRSIVTLVLGATSAGPLAAAAGSPRIHYRSIGTAPGVLYASGTASIQKGETLVTFQGATLPNPFAFGAVGQGDRLLIGDETFFVLARVSPTQISVQSPAKASHFDAGYTLERAYGSLQAWESDRQGDLIGEDRLEIGVAYNDGVFRRGVLFEGSRTDADHYLQLTAAAGQRHDGVVGVGVAIEPEDGHAIEILDDFVRVDWLEVRGWKGRDRSALSIGANHASLSHLLLHDGEGDAVTFTSDRSAALSVSSSIVYRVGGAGIRVASEGPKARLTLAANNLSLHACGTGAEGTGGLVVGGSNVTVHARNVIALSNSPGDFLAMANGRGVWGASSHNMSSDASAPGPDSMTGVSARDVFVAPYEGQDNFHLSETSPARNSGMLLHDSDVDIDGQARPGGEWDRGADEFGTSAGHGLVFLGVVERPNSILVQWVTRDEAPDTRYTLSRSAGRNGPWEPVAPKPVPGLRASPGAMSYYYQLPKGRGTEEDHFVLDVSTSGTQTGRYGPVNSESSVGPDLFAEVPAGLIDGVSGVGIVYGVPESTSWRVIRRDEHHMDLELMVGGLFATLERGELRFRIQNGEDHWRVGSLSLPVFRTWLEGAFGPRVDLELVRAQEIVTFSPSVDIDVPLPSIDPARVVRVENRGGTSQALLQIAPLRWNGGSETLTLTRRLVLRLTIEDQPSP